MFARRDISDAVALSSNAMRSAVQRTTLENGLRICTEHLPGVRSISMSVMVECGSRDDGAGESGLAHLCEHMLFQGTTGRSAVQIARLMDGAGGSMGAFTTRDYTCYYASVLDDYCFHALDLLGDVLLNSVFPEDSLEREKRVILNEIRQMSDVPPYRVHERMKHELWRGHRLGQPIAGEPDAVARHSREDLIYYFQHNYTPDRMTICASGNVNHEDFTAQVRDAFWRMLGQNPPRQFRAVAPRGGVYIEPRPGEHAYFSLGIPAPCYTDERRYDLHLLARILGGGISSRLFRALRETGLAYDASAEYEAYHETGLLTIEGSAASADLTQVLELTLECATGLISGAVPPEEEELDRARTQLCAQHLIASQEVHTRMGRLGTQQTYFGRDVSDDEVLERLRACSLQSLLGIAAPALDLANLSLVAACPPELGGALQEQFLERMQESFVAAV